jgi:UDP-N-acetylmuramate--alanine ligase
VLNADDAESLALAPQAAAALTFGFESATIGVVPGSVVESPTGIAATVIDRRDGGTIR